MRLGMRNAVHRSAAPCSPTGFPRSTIGAVRLSFRVRYGTGRAPHAVTADRWAAFPPTRRVRPRALGAAQRFVQDGLGLSDLSHARHLRYVYMASRARMRVRARAISTARLSPSRGLHLRPIDQVVYLGPYRKEN